MSSPPAVQKLSRLRTPEDLRGRLAELGVSLPVDDRPATGADSPLAAPFDLGGRMVGNRLAILPMEGWDGTREGAPSALTRRRWLRFARSGAKLLFGMEAVAVRADGRANPRQLVLDEATLPAFAALREEVVRAHAEATGRTDDLVVGLQLTHSGRFARPEGAPRPRVAWPHPVLDRRLGIRGEEVLLRDEELDELVVAFVEAGVRARRAGFDFVDVKHCHGYLLHELLSVRERPGRYGGSLENRSGFLREVAAGLRARAPDLGLAVRLSAFDLAPFRPGPGGVGVPEIPASGLPRPFGGDATGLAPDLAETHELLARLPAMGVELVCVSAGSPYYNPHVQRPAFYPPSDGYLPPEDPLKGVARQVAATAELRRAHPGLRFVGSAYSYLQEWLPSVAGAVVREGLADAVGLGRMALSYPELPADLLAGRPLARERICRTFSDCTTAPRNGLVSGCYPLDPFYRERPEARELARAKARGRGGGRGSG